MDGSDSVGNIKIVVDGAIDAKSTKTELRTCSVLFLVLLSGIHANVPHIAMRKDAIPRYIFIESIGYFQVRPLVARQ